MSYSTLIAAHMGHCGGNIPGNTLASAELALRSGADIIELDVSMCADGGLFVFHPDLEKRCLNRAIDVRTLSSTETAGLHFVNHQGNATRHTILPLAEMLSALKGRCIVNIDKFGDHPAEIARVVRDLHMQDQVLVKASGTRANAEIIAQVAPDLPYMPIVYDTDEITDYLQANRSIRFTGVEAVWWDDSAPVAQEEYFARLHRMGKRVWANAILFDDKRPLSGGHTDDVSLLDDPEKGWGWLVRHGVDIIQTDWPMHLHAYLQTL